MDSLISWTPGVTLEQIEKQVILKAFRFYRGNKTTTSQALGISIRTLDSKLEKYQVDDKEQEQKNADERTERERFLARQRGVVQTNPQSGANVFGPYAGVSVESAPDLTTESDMPVPKRAQVQTVLPGHAAKSGAGKSR